MASGQAVLPVGLGERLKVLVRSLLGGDEAVICSGEGADQLVKFAVHDHLISGLQVLDREQHDDGDDGGNRLECDRPVGREPGRRSVCDPTNSYGQGDRRGPGVRGELSESMELAAAPPAMPGALRSGSEVRARLMRGSNPFVGIGHGVHGVMVSGTMPTGSEWATAPPWRLGQQWCGQPRRRYDCGGKSPNPSQVVSVAETACYHQGGAPPGRLTGLR